MSMYDSLFSDSRKYNPSNLYDVHVTNTIINIFR